MSHPPTRVLAVNGGSSSIKVALYECAGQLRRLVSGGIERIGQVNATLRLIGPDPGQESVREVRSVTPVQALEAVVEGLGPELKGLAAIGHRVVHGGPSFHEPQRVTDGLLAELRRITVFDPEHLPDEIRLIEACRRRFPSLPQLACFDTNFHHDLPRVAQLLPIPRRFQEQGLRRYGFHGLSYAYLMRELRLLGASAPLPERIILAHLGSGASLAAIHQGRPLDTSMGFSSSGGLMMGTRTGDLDPGVITYLLSTGAISVAQVEELVNHQSGLLGVSGSSADVRDLELREAEDPQAGEAIELFCYQARKGIGAFAAVLGGLDALIFTGGIGEHAPRIRSRITNGLGFLGIYLDEGANQASRAVVSRPDGRVLVRIIHTDEQVIIALSVLQHLGLGSPQDSMA